MQTTFSIRLAGSLKALGLTWLVSGIIFIIITKGPSGVAAWCIWGTAYFALGWALVGLPLVALGERARRVTYPLLILAGGLGGALVIASPAIVLGLVYRGALHWSYSLADLKWEAIAFLIAAATTALYRLLLDQRCKASGILGVHH